jgi:predicted aconitase with swiveling domain
MRRGRFLAAGEAEGEALALTEPLSFWGGIEIATGRIIDEFHPDRGRCVSGRILVMPGGRGSSSSASVLAEGIRRGTAPVAIILARADPILAVGALVAHALYGLSCPVVLAPIAGIGSGDRIRISTGAGDVALVEHLSAGRDAITAR